MIKDENSRPNGSNDPQRSKGSMMKALLVVVIALLLLVGAIVGALALTGGDSNAGSKKELPMLGDKVAGRQVALRPEINCVFCHSDDGTVGTGPSFKGFFGSQIKYDDGSSVIVDESVVRNALKHPIDKIVDGFEPRMPVLDDKLTETDKQNLIAYLASIGKGK